MIHIYFVLIPILIFISALFAACEASLFTLSRPQLETIRQSRPRLFKTIRRLLQRPDELLSTLIIGNETLNILIGACMVTVLRIYLSYLNEEVVGVVAVLLSSTLMLVFSEVLPKVLAFRVPVLTASFLTLPFSWFHRMVLPLRKVFLAISGKILKNFHIEVQAPAAISESDFKTLVELGEETGSLDRDEKEMIYNVFDFSDRPVSSVMTPWKDVFTAEENLPLNELLNRVRQRTFSRIPVVNSRNEVTGVLYTKELLKFLLQPGLEQQDEALKRAFFPPYIVSTHKKISTLFREFKLKKIHIALVVDEYGRHLGVVTLEDLLNALFRTQKQRVGEVAP